MKEYILSILAVATVGSIILIIAPEGEGGGIKKHICLIIGLATILVIISPMSRILEAIKEIDFDGIKGGVGYVEEYESIFYETLEMTEIGNLKSGIKSELKNKFGIDESECSVEITLKDGALHRILIRLYGSAIWRDSKAIEEHFRNLLGCEIVTAIN